MSATNRKQVRRRRSLEPTDQAGSQGTRKRIRAASDKGGNNVNTLLHLWTEAAHGQMAPGRWVLYVWTRRFPGAAGQLDER